MNLRLLAVALCGLAFSASVLAGCAPSAQAPAPQQPSASSAEPISTDSIKRMTADEIRAQITSSFPIEAPVPKGTVTRGEPQGENVWDYAMTFPESPEVVAAWYLKAYQGREWQNVSDTGSGGVRTLDFVKGGAESRVQIRALGADQTEAVVVLGWGVPLLNTQ